MMKQVLLPIIVFFLAAGFGKGTSANAVLPFAQTEERININTASIEELKRLPGVGQKLAERVIAHRAKHGAFKRPQDIVIVRGFSAKRYRQLAHLIRT